MLNRKVPFADVLLLEGKRQWCQRGSRAGIGSKSKGAWLTWVRICTRDWRISKKIAQRGFRTCRSLCVIRRLRKEKWNYPDRIVDQIIVWRGKEYSISATENSITLAWGPCEAEPWPNLVFRGWVY